MTDWPPTPAELYADWRVEALPLDTRRDDIEAQAWQHAGEHDTRDGGWSLEQERRLDEREGA